MATERLPGAAPLLKIDPATGALQERTFEVTITSGPDAGRVIPLQSKVTIGVHPNASLRVSDGAVSRYHAELEPRADGVLVRDLGSTNGTFLGVARIESALIVEPEAIVRVGKTLLRIAVSDRGATADAVDSFGAIRSASPAMQRVFGILARVAPTDSTVLLTGETGTGKDVLARAIHEASSRRTARFVVVDCASVAASLVESDLFGHVKGAFTGAVADRTGAFHDAHGGTLFLDEIGELPLELQPKLLRALEAGLVKRVGEDRPRRVDVRVIAATHRNLQAEVAEGRFRQDLYFRLAVVPVELPPLRQRVEDLPQLVAHFLRENGREDFVLPDQMLAQLRAYRWPGNVRELRNVVGRALAGVGTELATEPTPPPPTSTHAAAMTATPGDGPPVPYKEAKEQLVEQFTRAYLEDLSSRYGGNLTKMARAAGIARFYLRELMHRYGLKGED